MKILPKYVYTIDYAINYAIERVATFLPVPVIFRIYVRSTMVLIANSSKVIVIGVFSFTFLIPAFLFRYGRDYVSNKKCKRSPFDTIGHDLIVGIQLEFKSINSVFGYIHVYYNVYIR